MSRAPRAAGLHRAAERSRQSLRERSAALGPALVRHPRHVLLAAATVGLLLSTRELTTSLALAAAGVAALTAAGGPRLALLTVIVLLGGWGAGQARLEAIDAPGELLTPGDRVAGRAHLLTPPRPGRFGSSAELRMRTGRSAGVRLVGRFGAGAELPAQAGPGTAVDLAGAFRRPRPPDAGGFDFAAHLRRKGVAGELAVTRARSTGARRGGLAGAIDTARRRAERALAAGLDAPRAALARGMVLGQDERIDPAVRDDFRASGLAHVLAVSGQNVMLLAALALVLLAATGLPRGARILTAIALVVVYVPLAGAGPSLQRAGVMGAASLAALGLARPASRGYALLLAAVVTLVLNPRAVGDPGWQLSFVAVAGILTLAPPLRRGPLRALPRVLAEGVAITVAATLATAPLLAHHFGSVPVAGLPANVLALPLVAPIMWLGMLRAGLGQLTRPALAGAPAPLAGPLAAIAELLNRALAVPLGHLTGALASLAGAFAELPGAQLWIPLSSPALLAAGYAGIALGALAAARLARRVEPRVTVAGARWRRLPRERRVARVCAVAAVAGLVLARGLSAPAPPGALTVSFLDVGQGDATLIQHPDGTAVLFDGGPPEGRAARLLRASGVRRLAALVMTHPSRDHHGGLLEVVRRFPVDLLLDGGDGTDDGSFRATVAAAVDGGARRVAALAPMTLRVGGLTIRLLSPPPRPRGPPPEDPNPRAVVAVVSAGEFDLLLSADAESPTLAGLRLPDVDAIKVPHHGSEDPGLPQVLERLRPEWAVVPVGENDYGHPVSSTLAALRASGASVHRTDAEGTVRLTVADGTVRGRSERGRAVGDGP